MKTIKTLIVFFIILLFNSSLFYAKNNKTNQYIHNTNVPVSFAFVVYGKYIVLSKIENIEKYQAKYERVNNATSGSVYVVDIDNDSAFPEFSKKINKEFSVFSENGNSQTVKIKNLKILLQAVPHFGTLQEADTMPNPDEIILDFLWNNATKYIVGEIESNEEYVWACEKELKQQCNKVINNDTLVSTNSKNKILKKLNIEPQKVSGFRSVFKGKNAEYFLIKTFESTVICGEIDYNYYAQHIVKLTINGEVEEIQNLEEDKLFEVWDIGNDDIPEFIIKGNTKMLYMINSSEKTSKNCTLVEMLNFDCGC